MSIPIIVSKITASVGHGISWRVQKEISVSNSVCGVSAWCKNCHLALGSPSLLDASTLCRKHARRRAYMHVAQAAALAAAAGGWVGMWQSYAIASSHARQQPTPPSSRAGPNNEGCYAVCLLLCGGRRALPEQHHQKSRAFCQRL
jgi:hypothetical protein